jgi:TAT-translocated FGD2 family F420-dependent dehydrogenase
VPFGTGVTCPTYLYDPTVVAQAFASLALFYPGRVFLGLGTGEALNELAATGGWGMYPERHDRLLEAVMLIRELWTGEWINFKGDYYQAAPARLYDRPPQPIPLYIAASGPQSMRLSGQYGHGLITDPKSLRDLMLRAAHAEGLQASGRVPGSVPILVESFVVVGGEQEARQAAELWRFTPKAWTKNLLYDPDPRSIQRKADTEIPLEEVYKEWPVSTDPDVHVKAILKLFGQGATTVFVHSGQADQQRVIEFYGQQVLPRLRQPVAVPNVVGLNQVDAGQRLAEAGLFLSYTDLQDRSKLGDSYDRYGPGIVVSAEPAPGAQVPIGTGVTLGVRAP